MRWVGRQTDGNGASLIVNDVVVAQVVFYVAFYFFVVAFGRESAENLLVRLFHDVRQYVEPSPVRHSYHNVVHVVTAAVGNDGVQRGDYRFGTFQRKPFLPHVFSVHVIFKSRCFDQFVENIQFIFFGKRFLIAAAFHFFLQPLHDFGFRHVTILHADGFAVGFIEMRHDFAQGCPPYADLFSGFEHRIQIAFGKIEVFESESGRVGSARTHGIGFGEQMPPAPVAGNEIHNGYFLGRHACIAFGFLRFRRKMFCG